MDKTTRALAQDVEKLEARPIHGFAGDNDMAVWQMADALILRCAAHQAWELGARVLAVVDRITGEQGPRSPAAVRQYAQEVGEALDDAVGHDGSKGA